MVTNDIFTYTSNTNLFQLDAAARSLLAEVLKLSESISWKRFCSLSELKSLKEAEKMYATNYEALHQNVLAYLNMLQSYVNNHNYFELQDKFLNGEITAIRTLAIKSLNVLQLKIDRSKIDEEKIELQNVVDEIKISINVFLDILTKLKPKSINNHIVVSDPKAAEWIISKLSEPLTEERIKRTKDELKEYEELFFQK